MAEIKTASLKIESFSFRLLKLLARSISSITNTPIYLDFFRLHFYFVTSIRRVSKWAHVYHTIQGKIEMEISILKAEEADENPAGRGREPPQELPPPEYETLLKKKIKNMELRSRLVKKNLHDNFIMKIFALENIFRKIVLASDHKFLTLDSQWYSRVMLCTRLMSRFQWISNNVLHYQVSRSFHYTSV